MQQLIKKTIKILHIADMHNRHKGRLYYSTGKKINNGFIKNDYNVLQISDRDYLQSNIFNYKKPFFISFIDKTIENFVPDIILFGHVDSLNQNDFFYLKNKYRSIKFSQYFVDTLDPNFEQHKRHKKRFFLKYQFCDTNFITSDPKSLSFIDEDKTFFIPNVCDKSIDVLENYKFFNLDYDVFFALSHGQHRGVMKKGHIDERSLFINKLKIENIKTNFFGINKSPIWGNEFFYQLSKTKMGINFNRGKALKYYSSDRISLLLANGLLTFLQNGYSYENFFDDKKDAIYFNSPEELSDKIKYYSKNDKERCEIGFNGKSKYFNLFENTLVTKYMVEIILDLKISKKQIWMN
jgi:hypothetical protein